MRMSKKEAHAKRAERAARRAAGKHRVMTPERKAYLREHHPGGSTYGRDRGLVCPVCGQCYDAFRTGLTFDQVRRDIIAIGWCRKRNRVKNGRRSGVLGYMHEMKQRMWADHVAACRSAKKQRKRKER